MKHPPYAPIRIITPSVDQSTGRTRFLRANAYDSHNLSQTLLPSLEMLQGADPSWTATDVSFPSFYFKSQSAYKAMDLIPYLRPQELASVWAKLESGSCARLLSPEEKNWITLLKAVGGRGAGAMVSGAKSILSSGKRVQPDALRFLVASRMAGFLMQGDRDGSFRFWSGYRSMLFGTGEPDLFFRMLAAESTKPG